MKCKLDIKIPLIFKFLQVFIQYSQHNVDSGYQFLLLSFALNFRGIMSFYFFNLKMIKIGLL